MTDISLVLPFALPPAELAADLARALRTPALASLLSRTARFAAAPAEPAARALPHEAWLARTLDLGAADAPAFAAAVMRRFDLPPAPGTWFIVNPAHIAISRQHLLMSDMRTLQLGEADARALFEAAKPYVEEAGKVLLYGDAQTWFLRADDWAGLQTATPDAAAGMNLTDWLPRGERAAAFRKLQNEVQMLWYGHPVNLAREARGQAPVNAFWLWGAGAGRTPRAGPPLVAVAAAPWLAALAHRAIAAPPPNLAESDPGTCYYLGSLCGPAMNADWSAWLTQMQDLEQSLFAPALAALRHGRLTRLTLLLTGRAASIDVRVTPLSLRAFWRRPTLKRLTS